MQHDVAIGALIATCFGLGWAIAGVQGVPSRWRLSVLGIAILISLLISTGILWRLRSNPHLISGSGTFKGVIYWSSAAFETVAILVAVFALRWKGLKDYIMPTVAFIVGVHFFGLARAIVSGNRGFILVGAAMCVLAFAIILGLGRSLIASPQSMALTGFGFVYTALGPMPCANRSNQSMKPTAPWRNNYSVFAMTPCRGLSLSR